MKQWKTRAKVRRGAKGGTQTDEGGRREMSAGGDSGGTATDLLATEFLVIGGCVGESVKAVRDDGVDGADGGQ